MKKYIMPSLKVVNIENNAILAGSPSVGVDSEGTPTNVMQVRGNRRGADWDDED